MLIFTSFQVVFITAKIAFLVTCLSADQIYDFHIFTVDDNINKDKGYSR